MEHGIFLFDQIIISDPTYIAPGKADVFTCGGLSNNKIFQYYTPSKKTQSSPYGPSTYQRHSVLLQTSSKSNEKSYLLNKDMRKVRLCEYIVMKEEEKYGQYSRDPYGYCVPTAMVR
jgi:hypothetical protein